MVDSIHNPALGAYIFAWQNHIAKISQSQGGLTKAKLANEELLQALANYQNWCARPNIAPTAYKSIWQNDVASMHDCGGLGPRVLVIPSLINTHNILDLAPDVSLIADLKQKGFHVFLLKWQTVTPQCTHNSKQYIGTIRQAGFAIEQDFSAIGYCVGGTLLNMAAQNLPGLRSQILIGAPWNFHHDQCQIGAWARSLAQQQDLKLFFDQSNALYGLMPSTMIDYFFAGLNPLQFVQKFRNAHNPDPIFDALENWLTSGLDLSLPFSKELVMDWMRDDTLSKSNHHHETPTLVVHGARDHIAPPASCLGILKTLGQYDVIKHPSGHVGLMIGQKARQHLWPQIVNYLQNDHT